MRSSHSPTLDAGHRQLGRAETPDHPLRRIRDVVDATLARLLPEFDRMYTPVGRASVPPGRLLKASLLIALYSVRSKHAFCEEFECNLLNR